MSETVKRTFTCFSAAKTQTGRKHGPPAHEISTYPRVCTAWRMISNQLTEQRGLERVSWKSSVMRWRTPDTSERDMQNSSTCRSWAFETAGNHGKQSSVINIQHTGEREIQQDKSDRDRERAVRTNHCGSDTIKQNYTNNGLRTRHSWPEKRETTGYFLFIRNRRD